VSWPEWVRFARTHGASDEQIGAMWQAVVAHWKAVHPGDEAIPLPLGTNDFEGDGSWAASLPKTRCACYLSAVWMRRRSP